MIRSAVMSLILTILTVGCSVNMDPEGYYKVEPVDDPLMLPYKFTVWKKKVGRSTAGNPILQQFTPVDINGSGVTGMYLIGHNWRPADSLTAVLFYADTEEMKTLSQINVNTARVTSHFPHDFDNDGVTEVAVAYTTRDTLWLHIIDPHQGGIARRPLVAGRDRDGNGFWDGSGAFCGAHDFNDDGYVELLVNCDVGYDLYPRKLICVDWFNDEIVWEYEVAGVVNSEHAYVQPLGPGNRPVVVFGVNSKGNDARTDDMDDQHSYLIALDENGKLCWKKETGGVFSSCMPVLIDYNSDGTTEVLTTCRYEAPRITPEAATEHGGMLKMYDLYGGVLDSVDCGPGKIARSVRLLDFDSDGSMEFSVSLSDASIIIYDQRLRPVRKARFYTAADIWHCRDFLGTGNNQLLVASRDNKLWLLDKGLKPLAQFGEGEELLYGKWAVYRARESQQNLDLIVAGNGGQVNYFLTLVKSPWSTVFFRRPLLAFLAALLPMGLVAVLIWFSWQRTRKQKSIISQQRDRLNVTLEDLKAAQEKLIAIEEYNKTQDALRASEKKYGELANLLPQAVFEMDLEGNFTFANRYAFASTGYTQEDLDDGLNVVQLFVPEERERVLLNVGKASRGEEFEDHEYIALRKDKSTFPALIYSSSIIRDGKPVGLRGIILDITERKRAEEALRVKEERYALATSAAKVGVWDWDLRHGSFYLDPNIKALLGYQDSEILNDIETWTHYIHPDDKEPVMQAASDHLEGRTPAYVFEHRMLHKDGTIRWFLVRGTAIRDDAGNVLRMVGTDTDITERKRAEAALKESEEKFRALAEQSPNMIFINKKGRTVWANRRCEEIMGYGKEQFYSSDFDFLSLIAPDHRRLVGEMFARHMKGEEVPPYEYALITKQGKRIEAINTTRLIMYGGDKALLGIITDITERKRAEEALRESEERFRKVSASAQDAILMMDNEGRVSFWNEAAERVFGYRAEEILGKSLHETLGPERFHDAYRKGFGLFRETGEGIAVGQTLELVAVRRDGTEFPIELSVSTIRLKGKWNAVGILRDITERKRAEQALRDSEARYHELFDSVQEGIGVVDENEIIQFCNPAYALMFEEDSVDSLIGKNLLDYVPEDQTDLILSQTAIRKSNSTSQYELDIVTAKNRRKTILASVSPRFDKNNRYIGAFGAIMDITERKQAEEALRESEAKYRTLVNRLPAVTYIEALDKASTTLYISPQIEDLWGFTQAEYLSDPNIWRKQLHPDDRERVLREVARSRATGEPFASEYRMIHRHGEVRWFRDQAVIVYDTGHKPIHLQGIMFDITKRKQAEEALKSERDFIRSLLDTANSLVVCLDSKARITVFNKECEKVTGYAREEVIGDNWPEVFLPEEARHDGLKNFADWVRYHPRDMYEGPLRTKSGQIRTILWSNSVLFPSDSEKLTAIAVGQDVTERKQAERQLQVASQKRYNQVKEIAGGVSHEIFNALFPATSCLRKLSQRLDLTRADEVVRNRKLIQVVEDAVRRAIETTEQVTEYSKLESDGKVGSVSLRAILQEILRANESRIEELKVAVKLEMSGDLLLGCHQPHVYSLFNNLTLNALDALAEVEERNIFISACEKGGRLRIEFADSGVGIPPENLDKIFDAFFSTKPKTGTGLGLAISKKIVELYDGSLQVESSLDKGTKFTILL